MIASSVTLLRTQSDERLVALAASGHERAFEAIVERYRRPLLRHIRRILPEARAEDALQQALVAAWTGLRRGDDVHNLRAWLHRIVHNTALNALRVNGYDYDELRETLQGVGGPAELAERRALIRHTFAGLAALPERQREALLAIAVEGRSQEEVAEELGMSSGAVRQLVHRARTSLRAAATAVTPMPLVHWLAAAERSSEPIATRVAELVAGGATAGVGATLAKAGAVAVIAGGAVSAPVVVDRIRDTPPPARTAAASPPRGAGESAGSGSGAGSVAAASTRASAGSGEISGASDDRGRGRGRGRDDGRGRGGDDGGRGSGGAAPGAAGSPEAATDGDGGRGRGRGRGGDDSSASGAEDGSGRGRGRGRGGDDSSASGAEDGSGRGRGRGRGGDDTSASDADGDSGGGGGEAGVVESADDSGRGRGRGRGGNDGDASSSDDAASPSSDGAGSGGDDAVRAGDSSSGGDSSGGDPSRGDSSGGDPSRGDSSGGDPSGGDDDGGDRSAAAEAAPTPAAAPAEGGGDAQG